ncbi:MAG: hypothetical protein M3083_19305 [Actinomycetota bacterium]|nr:hypothetical protein [Actinomycetota bacterium]
MTNGGASRVRPGAAACVLTLAITLAACGGSGGSGTPATTPSATSITTTSITTTSITATSITTTSITAASAPTVAPTRPLGPERVPIPGGPALGPVGTNRYPQTIDGIQCQASEQVVYHIHAHLSIFVDGQPRQVPKGIGIGPPTEVTETPSGGFVSGGSCFYWLHTHADDGIAHIESPTQKLYTLGQFFDVWGQPLAVDQVGPATGKLTIFVDRQPFAGNPRDIELKSHGEVQLDVGTVVPPQPLVDWTQAGL